MVRTRPIGTLRAAGSLLGRPAGCVLVIWMENSLMLPGAPVERAKTDPVRMAHEVANMFEELRALTDRHAKLHADRARLQADVDRLASELAQARRPWRRRWL